MRVGIDFDNTIICYDGLFHRVAMEQGLLPDGVPASKGKVRDCLRQSGQEDAWTAMQGLVYGDRIGAATPFPGFSEFLRACQDRGVEVAVVSHKTRTPYLGPPYDLHQAAYGWLEHQGFYDGTGLTPDQVYFELTKQGKLERIGALNCAYFVDDLPEFLAEPGFPAGVVRIHFDPSGSTEGGPFRRVRSWQEIAELVLGTGDSRR